jgi:hypothetical protein
MAQTVETVPLKKEALQAFEAYIAEAEAAMDAAAREGRVLWAELDPARARKVRSGDVVAELWSGKGPVDVPDSLIHDWIGASFVPGVTVQQALALVQDYDNHKNIYQPEVIGSALINRKGNDFQIYLRLLKKKIITVVLDTFHDVHYAPLNSTCWRCRSYTTRILEVEDAGTAKEQRMAPDTGYGFLWRLYSYWTFAEKDGGVFIECRAISLTRDIPLVLAWIIKPMVRKLPQESLVNTLKATRQALL